MGEKRRGISGMGGMRGWVGRISRIGRIGRIESGPQSWERQADRGTRIVRAGRPDGTVEATILPKMRIADC